MAEWLIFQVLSLSFVVDRYLGFTISLKDILVPGAGSCCFGRLLADCFPRCRVH